MRADSDRTKKQTTRKSRLLGHTKNTGGYWAGWVDVNVPLMEFPLMILPPYE
jgi:hypothetical protein